MRYTELAKHCIITGGSGFIGTHLIRLLLSLPSIERITVIDLVPPQVQDSRISFIPVDLRKPVDVKLDSSPDICFHLAALCKEPKYGWDDYFLTNHIGTKHLCDFAEREGVRTILFTSTMMVYRAGEHRYCETDATAPDTAYGISKLLAESVLEKWAAANCGKLLIVRPGVVFGRGEQGNFTRLWRAIQNHRFAYVGRSDTVKANIYVKDLSRFLIFLASSNEAGSGVFNAAMLEPVTIREICETICRVRGIHRIVPTIPFRLALLAGYMGEIANAVGIETGLHHRRIEKLFYSTDISADAMVQSGFTLNYNLASALVDWWSDCSRGEIV
jgi:Nucleoside-diphosphate-sugar epimerases